MSSRSRVRHRRRALPHDVVQRIPAAMSDQESARVKGKQRAAASAAKIWCRVLAFTGPAARERSLGGIFSTFAIRHTGIANLEMLPP